MRAAVATLLVLLASRMWRAPQLALELGDGLDVFMQPLGDGSRRGPKPLNFQVVCPKPRT